MTIPFIQSYCHIKDNRIIVDGKLFFEQSSSMAAGEFLITGFKKSEAVYAKFYKMDEISKLGFLAAGLLINNRNKLIEEPEETGIVLSNGFSTLVTDSNFQESINDYLNFYPSPSVFVYTLPNIMIGEISIRHHLKGENAFFIFEKFNAEFLTEYINHLFSAGKVKACLGGWVDLTENDYEAFMYLITMENHFNYGMHLTSEIEKLYENKN